VSGGTLHQHLPDVVGNDAHRAEIGVFGEHGVHFEPGSLVCRLLGDRSDVKSYHHQGIDRVAPTLVATGWADDGTVEVLERADHAFAIGVQWHPEQGEDAGLFRGLVEAASNKT
jgi:gamma-glutamyl-gamma-aminobutyrate hydrolase PuuD